MLGLGSDDNNMNLSDDYYYNYRSDYSYYSDSSDEKI